jgi:hypothetical protein
MENIKINGFLRVALGTVVVVGVLAVNGCIFGTSNGNGNGEPPPGLESPGGVVEYIEDSYIARDIEDYKECLSPNFTFYFNPLDVGKVVGDYIIEDSWGYDEEVGAIDNMFDQAYDIEIDLVGKNVGDPEPNDDKYTAYNVQIVLTVLVEATFGYRATGFVDFEFESYNGEKGEKLWRVLNWWDKTEAEA